MRRPVQRALHKYGPENVKLEVLVIGFRDYILDLERKAIDYWNTRDRTIGYNSAIGGRASIASAPETRLKMSRSQKKRVRTPEEIAKMAATLKGRIFSAAHKEKLRVAALNRFGPSAETRLKYSQANKGNKHCLGRVLSEETKAKISRALVGKPSSRKGCKVSEETKLKQRMSKIGKKANPKQLAALAAGRLRRWSKSQ